MKKVHLDISEKATGVRVYAAITSVKNTLLENGEELGFTSDLLFKEDLSRFVGTNLRNLPVVLQCAFLCVLQSGEFEKGYNYSFSMPSTRACLDNWKVVQQDYRRKRPVKVLVWDPVMGRHTFETVYCWKKKH